MSTGRTSACSWACSSVASPTGCWPARRSGPRPRRLPPRWCDASVDLTSLNAVPGGIARQRLLVCCSCERWAAEVAAARPYASAGELLASSDAATAGLAPGDLEQALAGHPRIGERGGVDQQGASEEGGV